MIKDRKLIDPPLHLHVNKPIKDFKKLKGQRAKYIDDVLIGLRDLAIPWGLHTPHVSNVRNTMFDDLPKRQKFRFFQIIVNGIVFILSLFACVPSGWTFNFFNFECVLYADLSVSLKDNNTVVLDWSKSTWGKPIQCHMATYAPVVASIHAFIWIWFYSQMEELDGKM